MRPALASQIATVGGVGFAPSAPGTFGSLATLPLAWALHAMGGIWLMVAATLALAVLGYWATRVYLAGRSEDPKEVVIDEVVGQLIALWPLSAGLTLAGADPTTFPWPGWVGGFLMFRFFDIVKPPPVSWADRPGALGVMLDDVVAGALAGTVMLLAAGVAHGWF
ncbi:MAG: phosphatidylglycerophosphatase A [Pseudomonadota bacterium]